MPTTATSPAVMPPRQLVISIYARKSRLSDASESVSTQVSICRDYIDKNYPGALVHVYDQDEGFSGKNTNRPGFQRLMQQVHANAVNVIVVYRLDRIGRSLRDFCNLLDDLQRHNVTFVSVRENFGGDTPIARTMMMVASLFSQLERELIAERIKDALYDRARMGHWLGGLTPTGYQVQRVSVKGSTRQHTHCVLAPDPVPLAQVVHLYERFVELGSLSALVTYTLQQGLFARRGGEYHRKTLRSLLSNPVYCTADDAAWLHFSGHNYALNANREDFDGVHGLMPYARTRKLDALTVTRPTSDWIIAVGAHPGAVPGALWVKAQQIFEQNKELGAALHGRRTHTALLSGLIRCGKCGAPMRPKAYGKPLPDGSRKASYVCKRKDDSRGAVCDGKNALVHEVDPLVVDHLRHLSEQYSALSLDSAALHQSQAQAAADSAARLRTELQSAQRKLDNLTDTLAEGVPAAARQQIYHRMDELTAHIADLDQQIQQLDAAALTADDGQQLIAIVSSAFGQFGDAWQQLTHDEKCRLIRTVVDRVVWDGEKLDIFVLGDKTLPG